MRVSIVTVCFNALKTLPDTLQSFQKQTYRNKQQVIVDGDSTDGTHSFLKDLRNDDVVWISQKDQGIYDAMNKGIKMCEGDVIGILNADDQFYDDDVIHKVVGYFDQDPSLDVAYGDIVFEKLGKIWRHYSAKNWKPSRLAWGFMPPHPAIFLRREVFDRYGYYKTGYQIAADYELVIRLLWKNHIKATYMPLVTTKMSLGGVSTRNLRSNIQLNREILQGCRENGLATNYFKIYSKYLIKWRELL